MKTTTFLTLITTLISASAASASYLNSRDYYDLYARSDDELHYEIARRAEDLEDMIQLLPREKVGSCVCAKTMMGTLCKSGGMQVSHASCQKSAAKKAAEKAAAQAPAGTT